MQVASSVVTTEVIHTLTNPERIAILPAGSIVPAMHIKVTLNDNGVYTVRVKWADTWHAIPRRETRRVLTELGYPFAEETARHGFRFMIEEEV